MHSARLFAHEAALLLAVVLPVAIAERLPWYALITLAGVIVGFVRTVRQDAPVLGPRSGSLFVMAAFAWLLTEYLLLGEVMVLALAHFMLLVCISRLVSRRTMRDHAQLLILLLLLLVVAAIVSGNMLFAIALFVFLTVGTAGLIRFHLAYEQARVRAAAGRPAVSQELEDAPDMPVSGPAIVAGLSCLALAAVVFIVCPRLEAGFLGHLESRQATMALTGFSGVMELRGGEVQELSAPVMRVQMEASPPLGVLELDRALYFRGTVLYRYVGRRGYWTWRRGDTGSRIDDDILVHELGGTGGTIRLGRGRYARQPSESITKRFWLEPRGTPFLFGSLGASELSSKDIDRVREWVGDGVVQLDKPASRIVRYTLQCPRDPANRPALSREPSEAAEPPVLPPSPDLPREAEILARVDDALGDPGQLNIPATRERYVTRLEDWLRSRHRYELSGPPTRAEPIGEFLLRTRAGNCQHFASAMAVICQLQGIPARVVGGYRGGEYNEVADLHLVREKDAHSWVEVYIPGWGWSSYDPTPGLSREETAEVVWFPEVRNYLDYLQFQWANLVVTYDAQTRAALFTKFTAWLSRPAADQAGMVGVVSAFIRELFGGRMSLSPTDRLLYWVFALLVLTLVALLSYVVLALLRRLIRRLARWSIGRRTCGVPPGAEFYARYCRRLSALDLDRPGSLTPYEHAQSLAQRLPDFADAPQLVKLYYQVLYGAARLSAQHKAWADDVLERLARLQPPKPAGE